MLFGLKTNCSTVTAFKWPTISLGKTKLKYIQNVCWPREITALQVKKTHANNQNTGKLEKKNPKQQHH